MEDMDTSAYIVLLLVGLLIWAWILFAIIKSAVKAALYSADLNLLNQTRLLIKLLNKQGVSKQELEDLHKDSNDDFWKKLESKEKGSETTGV
jgi:hypothetical protein